MRKYIIADCKIAVDLPDELIHPNLRDFSGKFEKADVVITMCRNSCDSCSFFYGRDFSEFDADDDRVIISDNKILTEFKDGNFLNSVCLSESGGVYYIKCNFKHREKYKTEDTEELFDRMKGAIFCAMQKKHRFILHSASVIIKGKVYAFSALSGTGKTTHIKLLQKKFGCPVFNGDLMAFGINEGVITAYALPWCGESGEYTAADMPLGGIIFLNRGSENSACAVSGFSAEILLMQRLYAMNLTDESLSDITSGLDEMAAKINFANLKCLPNENAAVVSYRYITEKFTGE